MVEQTAEKIADAPKCCPCCNLTVHDGTKIIAVYMIIYNFLLITKDFLLKPLVGAIIFAVLRLIGIAIFGLLFLGVVKKKTGCHIAFLVWTSLCMIASVLGFGILVFTMYQFYSHGRIPYVTDLDTFDFHYITSDDTRFIILWIELVDILIYYPLIVFFIVIVNKSRKAYKEEDMPVQTRHPYGQFQPGQFAAPDQPVQAGANVQGMQPVYAQPVQPVAYGSLYQPYGYSPYGAYGYGAQPVVVATQPFGMYHSPYYRHNSCFF